MGGHGWSEAFRHRAKGSRAHVAPSSWQTCLQTGFPFRFLVSVLLQGHPHLWSSSPGPQPPHVPTGSSWVGAASLDSLPRRHSEAPGPGQVRSLCAGAVPSGSCCPPGSPLPAAGSPCPARHLGSAQRAGLGALPRWETCPLAPVPAPVSPGCCHSESPQPPPPSRPWSPLGSTRRQGTWAPRTQRVTCVSSCRPCLCLSWSTGSFSEMQRRACSSGS